LFSTYKLKIRIPNLENFLRQTGQRLEKPPVARLEDISTNSISKTPSPHFWMDENFTTTTSEEMEEVITQGGTDSLSHQENVHHAIAAETTKTAKPSDDDEFVPVKRKRGRPPKSYNSSNASQNPGPSNSDNNSSFMAPPQSARRSTRIHDMQRNAAQQNLYGAFAKHGINQGVSSNPTKSTNQHLLAKNSFNILSDNENEVIVNKNKPDKSKSPRIPEIKVLGTKYNDLQTLLAPLKISNMQVKMTQNGIRILLHTSADFLAVCKALRDANKDFFTHDLPENRRARFVLYGVPALDVNDITENLKEKGVIPVEVRRMKLIKKRYDEEANYIVYFAPGTADLNRLRKIKAVCFAICRWDHYNNAKRGPIQCHRCQNLGHGQRNCNLPFRCVICSEQHPSIDCPLTQETGADSSKLKCANCGGNHAASFTNCDKKVEFVNRQQQLKEGRKTNMTQKKKTNAPPFIFKGVNFPKVDEYGKDKSSHFAFQFNNKNVNKQQTNPTNIENSTSFSALFNNNDSLTSRRIGIFDENSTSQNKQNKNQNLFSITEMTALINEIISQLRGYRTREDQFRVAIELSVKYLYYNLP